MPGTILGTEIEFVPILLRTIFPLGLYLVFTQFDRTMITEKCLLSMNITILSLMINDNESHSGFQNSIESGKDFGALCYLMTTANC